MTEEQAAVADLLAAALAERDDEEACSALIERLWEHPDFAAARAAVEPLLTDPDAHVAEVAIDVYSGFGLPDAPEADRRARMARILALLDAGADGREPHWRVIESVAYAMQRLWLQDGAAHVAAYAGHPEERVRTAVVHGIGRADDPAAVAALIALSADPVDEVRDWATFGLGAVPSASRETPEVTAALVARLADEHGDTRDEAIAGLALRRDPRAIDPLVARVSDGWRGPLLARALIVLSTTFPDDPRLVAAVAEHFPDGVPDDVRAEALDELAHRDEHLAEENAQ